MLRGTGWIKTINLFVLILDCQIVYYKPHNSQQTTKNECKNYLFKYLENNSLITCHK